MFNQTAYLAKNLIILSIGVALLSGCAVRFGGSSSASEDIALDEMKSPELGLIYGKINISTNDYLEYVTLQRVGKIYAGLGAAGRGESVHVTVGGVFIAENLVPGKYRIVSLTLRTSYASLYELADKFTVTVKPGGIHYAGTYDYKSIKQGGIGYAGSFTLNNVSSKKTRLDALNVVKLTAKGTKWLKLLK